MSGLYSVPDLAAGSSPDVGMAAMLRGAQVVSGGKPRGFSGGELALFSPWKIILS